MAKISSEREERRRVQKEIAEDLKSSGALEDIFTKIDAGVALTGEGGLLGGMLKAALGRGLEAELSHEQISKITDQVADEVFYGACDREVSCLLRIVGNALGCTSAWVC